MDQSSSKNIFQRFLSLFAGKNRREPTEDEADYPLVSISRPDLKFRIQDSLKHQGLFFVDLESGTYIDGLIDLPSIGLTFSRPQPEEIVQSVKIGFLNINCQSATDKSSHNDDSFELDAVLYFEYDGPECTTGYLQDLTYLCYLKVWNDVQLYRWETIINNVVKDLTVDSDNGISVPLVRFLIATSFIPDHPEKDSPFIVPKRKPGFETDDAVSSIHLNAGDEDEYEEDEGL